MVRSSLGANNDLGQLGPKPSELGTKLDLLGMKLGLLGTKLVNQLDS